MKLFGREVGGSRGDDPDDSLDTEVDDLDADTQDDPLADFDDDARQTIEQVLAQKLAAQQQTYFEQARQQAQARGFDYAADGSLVLANPAVAQQWVGTPTPTAAAPPPVQDAQDTPPDPTLYPEQYNAWIERQIEKRVTAERQSYQSELGGFKQLLAQQAVGSATQRATATLERLGQGQIAQHPMFHEAFSALLLQNPQEKWGDDMNLARWAMLLAPDLLAAQPLPPPTAPRTAPINPAAIAGNYASRVGAPGFQPSRETARAPKQANYSEEDTFHAQQLGLPVEEVIALRDPSGVAYLKYKEAKRSKARR